MRVRGAFAGATTKTDAETSSEGAVHGLCSLPNGRELERVHTHTRLSLSLHAPVHEKHRNVIWIRFNRNKKGG